jgi:hypothetical protein
MDLKIFGLIWSLKAEKVYFSLSHWGLIKGLKIFVLKMVTWKEDNGGPMKIEVRWINRHKSERGF